MTKNTKSAFRDIDAVKSAIIDGCTVKWANAGYDALYDAINGYCIVVCVHNGYTTQLGENDVYECYIP